MTIQLTASAKWNPSRITINPSNGVAGNNHLAIKNIDQFGRQNYVYDFKNKAASNNPLNIIDSNPLSYFEYESINVDKKTYNPNATFSENEFSYIVDNGTIKDASNRSLFNWSNHPLEEPLVLDFTMHSNSPNLANSITINPYFGSSKSVKISNVYVTSIENKTEDILSSPIYVGVSNQRLFEESSGNYYYDSVTIKFIERKVASIRVVMQQAEYTQEDILHSYWVTDYTNSISDNSPFFGSSKFNPESLSKDIYQEVIYDKDAIIAPISNPNIFSREDVLAKRVSVVLKKKSTLSSPEMTETFNVPIRLQKEILPAKRMAIGLRGVTVEYLSFDNSAEMISLPYKFDRPVASLMLGIESDLGITSQSSKLISSYVSVDDGKNWLSINPSQFGFNSSSSTANPEILVFNQNVPQGFKLPGVYYYNYPEVPKEVKEVIVKIVLQKDQVNNMAPMVYSYMLAAKVNI
jgi:hypothetical protein